MTKIPCCTNCYKQLDKNTNLAWAIPADIHGLKSPNGQMLMTAICPDCYALFMTEMSVANTYINKVFDSAVAKQNIVNSTLN
jgi:hypothetical protein